MLLTIRVLARISDFDRVMQIFGSVHSIAVRFKCQGHESSSCRGGGGFYCHAFPKK